MSCFFLFLPYICYDIGMIKCLFTFLFIALVLPVTAQAQVKDSFYFMKDDGVFSDEEKDEEALYIYKQCQRNPFQKVYFDCGCIAGDFRLQRNEEKLIPQGELINRITSNPREECVNTTVIAGDTYTQCLEYSETFRSRARNNEEYCQCAANKAALGFKKKPDIRLRNIEKIRSGALVSCARIYKSPR